MGRSRDRGITLAVVRLALAASVLGCGPSSGDRDVPPPAVEVPVTPPAVAPSTAIPAIITLTNGTAAELDIGDPVALTVVDVEGRESPIGLELPSYACECACDAPLPCPCDPPSVRALAVGASMAVPWSGAITRLSHVPEGVPCHERIDPPRGRYLISACDRMGSACGSMEVELPARSPITLSLGGAGDAASCADVARHRRAVRIALASARLEGVAPAFLEGCDAEAAICDAAGLGAELDFHVPDAPPTACAIGVSVLHDAWHVRITPRARDGAPIGMSAAIAGPAIGNPLRTWVEASTWAVSDDGAILIAGVPDFVSYTHGGAPAQIASVTLRVTSTRAEDAAIVIERVEWLGGGSPRDVLFGAPEPSSVPPRGTAVVRVGFDVQSALVSYHGAPAASRVTLSVGGLRLVVIAEHRVAARTPRER